MDIFGTNNPGFDLSQFTEAELIILEGIAGLGDPGADRILFWDESANAYAFLEIGSGLSITGTTLTATGGGTIDGSGTANEIAYWVDTDTLGTLAVATYPSLTEIAYVKGVTSAIQTQLNTKGDVTGPSSSVDNSIVRFDSTTGKVIQGYTSGAPTISDTGAVTIPLTSGNSLIVDTSTFVVDATNNRVGIGTATPGQTLAVDLGLEQVFGVDSSGNFTLPHTAASGFSVLKAPTGRGFRFQSGSTTLVDFPTSAASAIVFGYARLQIGDSSGAGTSIYLNSIGASDLNLRAGDGNSSRTADVIISVKDNQEVARFTDTLTLAMGSNSITMTGSLAATGARVTKGWFTDIESTNMPTVGGTSLSSTFQALDADLTSWAGVTRASGFDTFAATPSSANLIALVTDETGTGALVFGTAPTFTTSITTPSVLATANDSGAIGAAGTAFSDLFLASGAVINFGNGEVTLTAGANSLTLAGGEFTFGANTAYFTETDNGNSSTADTIDWKTSNKQKSTLTGNCTFTFTAPSGPCSLLLKLVQDATGSRTVTWPAAVKWPSGTAPTLTTTANKIDIITFYYDGTNYYGNSSLNYTA